MMHTHSLCRSDTSRPSAGCPLGGSGADAIPALPDLCLRIVSRRLGYTSLDDVFVLISLKAPARPGLSLSLCASAGAEPGGGGMQVFFWRCGGPSGRPPFGGGGGAPAPPAPPNPAGGGGVL